jgi:hypothetical protein
MEEVEGSNPSRSTKPCFPQTGHKRHRSFLTRGMD